MKVLHTYAMSEPAFGILRQLEAEIRSSEHLGISWQSVLYVGKSIPRRVVERSPVSSDNRIAFKLAYYWWLYKKSRDFDVILLRYSTHDPFQLLFILLCRRAVYTVHHALEVSELSLSESKLSRIKTGIEWALGPLTLSFVDGIVAVLPEILDYEMQRRLLKRPIPTAVYPNGIDYYDRGQIPARGDLPDQNAENQIPELLFISSVFAPWQGLEELFDDATTFDGGFICHIVGKLTEQQSRMLDADDRFVIHGLQEKEYINELIARCDLGISNLTPYKKNLNNIAALKVREYLLEGLAVYAGHGDVMPDSFEYFRNGPVDIAAIVSFAIENRNNDRVLVSDSARPYIEKEILLKELYSFLVENQKVLFRK